MQSKFQQELQMKYMKDLEERIELIKQKIAGQEEIIKDYTTKIQSVVKKVQDTPWVQVIRSQKLDYIPTIQHWKYVCSLVDACLHDHVCIPQDAIAGFLQSFFTKFNKMSLMNPKTPTFSSTNRSTLINQSELNTMSFTVWNEIIRRLIPTFFDCISDILMDSIKKQVETYVVERCLDIGIPLNKVLVLENEDVYQYLIPSPLITEFSEWFQEYVEKPLISQQYVQQSVDIQTEFSGRNVPEQELSNSNGSPTDSYPSVSEEEPCNALQGDTYDKVSKHKYFKSDIEQNNDDQNLTDQHVSTSSFCDLDDIKKSPKQMRHDESTGLKKMKSKKIKRMPSQIKRINIKYLKQDDPESELVQEGEVVENKALENNSSNDSLVCKRPKTEPSSHALIGIDTHLEHLRPPGFYLNQTHIGTNNTE
ncbi:hypothetical protein BC833DRAFT_617704 [Globomyces pollinis-pini]|nr:hypothetical protein BC833DRAFT_617704 [Globomyces pollinis-pini]